MPSNGNELMNAHLSDLNSNPFRPPTQDAEYDRLAQDTEFLVSTECVLCGDEVCLPPICILSGETDELVRQQSALKWTPRWLVLVRALLIGLLLPLCGSLMVMVSNSSFLGKQSIRNLAVAPWLFIAIIFLGTMVSILAAHRMTRHVSMTWYIETGRRAALVKQRRIYQSTIIVCVFTTGFSVYVDVFVPLGLLGLLGTVLAVNSLSRLGQPILSGRHQGLNVITGLSPLFLQRVQSIIALQGR